MFFIHVAIIVSLFGDDRLYPHDDLAPEGFNIWRRSILKGVSPMVGSYFNEYVSVNPSPTRFSMEDVSSFSA